MESLILAVQFLVDTMKLTKSLIAVMIALTGNVYAESVTELVSQDIKPWHQLFSGQRTEFLLEINAQLKIDRKQQGIRLRLERFDNDSFDLAISHEKYAVEIIRRKNATTFFLPKHKIVYEGTGKTHPKDHLTPDGVIGRLISPDSTVTNFHDMLAKTEPSALAYLLVNVLEMVYDSKSKSLIRDKLSIAFGKGTLRIESKDTRVFLKLAKAGSPPPTREWADVKYVSLQRDELERQLTRGVRRATEVLAPGASLTKPNQKNVKIANGELRWIDGHRVVLLKGTPEQIGKAHGTLLNQQAQRCIDSVLYSFGTAQTIVTGKWFRHELDHAYAKLAPHIPERHKVETRAMAASLGLDPGLCETLNVFPELFHCSGFAAFGKATVDGKLYHGRVLDYMTTIGLQDAATTFIVAPEGKHAFANVGYAGFIGSVSGMNDQAISLGEMGGRGEGKWDGVPMATLMRRALEECSTLDEVMDLWKNNPRTCEYYYVFADGKTNRAVGVAAVPEKVEFIFPGQSDPRIGAGIEDTVVMSAGSRLAKLRERVTEKHGKIDLETARWLMSRPVAMQSNLHNVLFVPADGLLYVANADHKRPAAECKYVKLDLQKLLGSFSVGKDTKASAQ
jgi:hypothetical protein